MTTEATARLVLADGEVFEGEAFGARVEATGEVVFNTSMSGYQEILTDPSYARQMLTLSVPEVGNVGVNPEDEESDRIHPTALIIRNLSDAPSNWRSRETLEAYLTRHGVAGIQGVDTRRLVRHLREAGAQPGLVTTSQAPVAELVERARAVPSLEGIDLVSGIGAQEAYSWTEGCGEDFRWGVAPPKPPKHHVVAFDYGLKRSMLRLLVDAGCRVTVVPANASAETALGHSPDGIFLANGPGDPGAVPDVAETIASLLGKKPLFGICMGHQLLARAVGAKTYKLKFGHRGANQPVLEGATGRVSITAQNHGFAVDDASLPKDVHVTHTNLNDGTVEGLALPEARAFSVQYHPEASPGPHEARHLFDRFVELMESRDPGAFLTSDRISR